MLTRFASLARRNAPTLIEDSAGCLALLVAFYVGLVLPGLF